MKIYVLTVGDQQRLDLIAQQLGNIEYELIYSESEEVLTEYNKTYSDRQLKFNSRTLGLGEMGAWRIHVRAWEEIAKQECPCLIFEDNALISPDLAEHIPQIMSDIRDYGMISFAEHPKRSIEAMPYQITRWNLPLYMYGVTPFYADCILSRIDKFGYTFPIDSWIRKGKLTHMRVFSTSYKLASRRPRKVLGSYAQKNIPKKSYKITDVLYRLYNKIKYRL
jgi:GR25 family glycosyltransferase involved in LPS biosynthesis